MKSFCLLFVVAFFSRSEASIDPELSPVLEMIEATDDALYGNRRSRSCPNPYDNWGLDTAAGSYGYTCEINARVPNIPLEVSAIGGCVPSESTSLWDLRFSRQEFAWFKCFSTSQPGCDLAGAPVNGNCSDDGFWPVYVVPVSGSANGILTLYEGGTCSHRNIIADLSTLGPIGPIFEQDLPSPPSPPDSFLLPLYPLGATINRYLSDGTTPNCEIEIIADGVIQAKFKFSEIIPPHGVTLPPGVTDPLLNALQMSQLVFSSKDAFSVQGQNVINTRCQAKRIGFDTRACRPFEPHPYD